MGLGVDVARGRGGDVGIGVGVGGPGVGVSVGVGGADRSQTGLYSSYLLLLRFRALLPSAFAIQTCLAPGWPTW